MLALSLRPFDASTDRNLVLANWLDSHWANSNWAKSMNQTIYRGHHQPIVERLVELCPPVMAVNPDDPWHVFGWICGSPEVVHYVYVKPYYRRQKVTTRLLQAIGIKSGAQYTHRAERNPSVPWAALPKPGPFNPYLLFAA